MAVQNPIVVPAALDPLLAVQIQFMKYYDLAIGAQRGYTDYEKFVFVAPPQGDLIYSVYAQPGLGMREWLDQRPMTAINFKYQSQAVRRFADGIAMDLDAVKPSAGNPGLLASYMEAAMMLGETTAFLWPGLIAQAVTNGITKKWLPDGQKIFDSHPFNPDNTGLGSFRNYFSKTAQGGSLTMPLTYGNLIAKIKLGYTFVLPNGKEWPIEYKYLVTGSALFPTAQRLCSFDRLPVGEIFAQTLSTTNAGGDAANEVKQYGVIPLMLAGMPANTWMLVDASSEAKKSLAIKKRQDITWQQIMPGDGQSMAAIGNEQNDAGAIGEEAFENNATKYGPKARGEGYFRHWWGVMLCDGTP